jgi:uncharacterized protein YkwD
MNHRVWTASLVLASVVLFGVAPLFSQAVRSHGATGYGVRAMKGGIHGIAVDVHAAATKVLGSGRPLAKPSPHRISQYLMASDQSLTAIKERVARPGAVRSASGRPAGGLVLDGWGGLHPIGGVTVNTAHAPYWSGWDIARAIAIYRGGAGGWTLDGWGGVHPWGTAPAVSGTPYWPGWDIARALVILPGGRRGYELDGYGGVHAFGGAPGLSGYPYWPGWDIARGLQIHLNRHGTPDGGWTLDGWGSIHAFGKAHPVSNPHYYSGWNTYLQFHVVSGGSYLLSRFGTVDTLGHPAGINWSGYPDWGSWDIVRDVVPIHQTRRLPPSVPFPSRGEISGTVDSLMNANRSWNGLGPLSPDGTIDKIEGNGDGYNLASCGGPNQVINDRVDDMYSRNYFAHPIPGCAGTKYVFDTYYPAWGESYNYAGENIVWTGGYPADPLDSLWRLDQMWMGSPDHRANILSTHFQRVGCGAAWIPNGSYQGATSNIWIAGCGFAG